MSIDTFKRHVHQALLAPLIALISGCVGVAGLMGKSLNAYEGPERDASEVATILRTQTSAPSTAYLSKVDDVTYGDRTWRGFPSIVKVTAGEHKITIVCFVGNKKYAYPSLRATFIAGKTYELGCQDMQNNYASAFVIEVNGTAP